MHSNSSVSDPKRILLLGWLVVALLIAAKFWVMQGQGTWRGVDPGLLDPAPTAPVGRP